METGLTVTGPEKLRCMRIDEVVRQKTALLDLAVRLQEMSLKMEEEAADHLANAGRTVGGRGTMSLADGEYSIYRQEMLRYLECQAEHSILRDLCHTMEEIADTFPDAKKEWADCVRQRL